MYSQPWPPVMPIRRPDPRVGAAGGLEAGAQVEGPEPAAAGTIQRAHVVDFGNREAQEVDAHERADAAYQLAVAAGQLQPAAAVPGRARVGEHAELHRQRAVEIVAPERAPEREAQLEVGQHHPRTEQLV